MIWTAVLVASAGCYLLKLAGMSVPASVLSHPLITRIADFIPVALLAALVAVQVLGDGQRLTLDGRAVGLGVAVVLLLLKRSFLTIVVGAGAAAALLRLIG